MLARSHSTLLLFTLLSCIAPIVGRKHAHNRLLHQHPRRIEIVTSVEFRVAPQATTSSSSSTTASPLANDLGQLGHGTHSPSQNMLRMIDVLDLRLNNLEDIVASLMSSVGTTTATTTGETLLATGAAACVNQFAPPSSTTTTVSPSSLPWVPAWSEAISVDVDPTSSSSVPLAPSSTATVPVSIPWSTPKPSAVAATSSGMVTIKTTTTVFTASTPKSKSSALTTATGNLSTLHNAKAAWSRYTFRPDAQDNVAVYYGQSLKTTSGGLARLCSSPNVDIVILAFVNNFFAADGYPNVNFGPDCNPPNAAQQLKAPGLLSCPKLADQIKTCQKIGKPVLISLGGYIANTSFASDAQARHFAIILWNLFGAGKATPHLRPFGPNVIIDGFDIDNENHNTTYYTTFAKALRAHFVGDKSKKYYLSAAPQCPIPDESIPMGAMQEADFVWVQFYNSPSCNLNSTGFSSSFEQWSKVLTSGSGRKSPRLYIGGGAFEGAGSGYVPGVELKRYLGLTKSGVGERTRNRGGVMLWDGSAAMENVDEYGKHYLQYAKMAVT